MTFQAGYAVLENKPLRVLRKEAWVTDCKHIASATWPSILSCFISPLRACQDDSRFTQMHMQNAKISNFTPHSYQGMHACATCSPEHTACESACRSTSTGMQAEYLLCTSPGCINRACKRHSRRGVLCLETRPAV